jgi:hypothetical protein
MNNTCNFSHLRRLQLLMGILVKDLDKIPYVLVSILKAAPFIEKLEIHVSTLDSYSICPQTSVLLSLILSQLF